MDVNFVYLHTFKFCIVGRLETQLGQDASIFGLDIKFSHVHPGLNFLVLKSLCIHFFILFAELILVWRIYEHVLNRWRTLRFPVVVYELQGMMELL